MKITVTKGHFDKAIAITEKNRPSVSATKVCLIAQAVSDAFPKKKVNVTYTHAIVGDTNYKLPAVGRNLILRFDTNGAWSKADSRSKRENTALAKLRASLPVSFQITEVPEA